MKIHEYQARQILADHGIAVPPAEVVRSPDEAAAAFKALEATKFDWLVVDGQMHPIDGFELAAKAKEIQPGIKTVMISGVYEGADIIGHPIRKNFQKPVDTDALIAYLRGKSASER